MDLLPEVRLHLEIYEVTVNIFHTGECNILGAKSVDDLEECILLPDRNVNTIFPRVCNAPASHLFLRLDVLGKVRAIANTTNHRKNGECHGIHFVSFGPKVYSYETNPGRMLMKLKG